jgi:outer membrane protein
MRQFLLAAAIVLAPVAPSLAQTPPTKPQTPPPAQPAQPAAQPPRPFPEGAKIAYFNIQAIANNSAEGKVATSKVKALNDKKVTELNDKNKQLQTAEAKLQKEGGVMSDAARGQLEKEIDRLQKEIQRFTQDAQAEVQELQNELQRDFQRKLLPIVGQVGADKGLHMIFSVEESGLVWADTGLDMTAEIIKRLDAAKPAAK